MDQVTTDMSKSDKTTLGKWAKVSSENFEDLNKKLTAFNRHVNGTKRQTLESYNTRLGTMGTKSETAARRVGLLEVRIDNLNDGVDKGITKLADFAATNEMVGESSRTSAGHMREQASAMRDLHTSVPKLTQAMRSIGKAEREVASAMLLKNKAANEQSNLLDKVGRKAEYAEKRLGSNRKEVNRYRKTLEDLSRSSFFGDGFDAGAGLSATFAKVAGIIPLATLALGGLVQMLNGAMAGAVGLAGSVTRLAGALSVLPGIYAAIGSAAAGAASVMGVIVSPSISGLEDLEALADQVVSAQDSIASAQSSVSTARGGVTSAQSGVGDAQRNISQARERVATSTSVAGNVAARAALDDAYAAEEKALDRVGKANSNVEKALEGVSKAQRNLNKLREEEAELRAKIPPRAQELVDKIDAVKETWRGIWFGKDGERAGRIIGSIITGMSAVQVIMKAVEPSVERFSGLMDRVAGDMTLLSRETDWLKDNLWQAQDNFDTIYQTGKNLLPIVGGLASQMQKFTARVLESVEGWSEGLDAEETVGKFSAYLNRAFKSLMVWTAAFKNFGAGILTIFSETNGSVELFEGSLLSMSRRFRAWSSDVTESGKAAEYFKNSWAVLEALGRVFLSFVGMFGEMGSSAKAADSVVEFLNKLASGLDALGPYMRTTVEQLGPAMNDFFEALGKFSASMGEPLRETVEWIVRGFTKLVEIADGLPGPLKAALAAAIPFRLSMMALGFAVGNLTAPFGYLGGIWGNTKLIVDFTKRVWAQAAAFGLLGRNAKIAASVKSATAQGSLMAIPAAGKSDYLNPTIYGKGGEFLDDPLSKSAAGSGAGEGVNQLGRTGPKKASRRSKISKVAKKAAGSKAGKVAAIPLMLAAAVPMKALTAAATPLMSALAPLAGTLMGFGSAVAAAVPPVALLILAIAAIAGVIAAFATDFGGIRTQIVDVAELLGGRLNKSLGDLTSALGLGSDAAKVGMGIMKGFWVTLKSVGFVIGQIAKIILSIFGNALVWLIDTITSVINIFKDLWALIKAVFTNDSAGAMKASFHLIGDAFMLIVGNAVAGVAGIFADTFGAAGRGIVNFISEQLNWIIEKANKLPGVDLALIPSMEALTPEKSEGFLTSVNSVVSNALDAPLRAAREKHTKENFDPNKMVADARRASGVSAVTGMRNGGHGTRASRTNSAGQVVGGDSRVSTAAEAANMVGVVGSGPKGAKIAWDTSTITSFNAQTDGIKKVFSTLLQQLRSLTPTMQKQLKGMAAAISSMQSPLNAAMRALGKGMYDPVHNYLKLLVKELNDILIATGNPEIVPGTKPASGGGGGAPTAGAANDAPASSPGSIARAVVGSSAGSGINWNGNAPTNSGLFPFIEAAQNLGLMVTSTTGGSHAKGSQHYSGNAVDLSNGFNPTPEMDQLYASLVPYAKSGAISQLIYRDHFLDNGQMIPGIGGHNNHIHVGLGSGNAGEIQLAAMIQELTDVPGFKGFGANAMTSIASMAYEAMTTFGKSGAGGSSEPGAPFTGNASDLEAIIKWAAGQYGADSGGLLRIAQAESSMNPNAWNKTDINAQNGIPSKGLFQFVEGTFDSFAQQARQNNPQAWGGVPMQWLDPTAQALTASWAFTHGKAPHWATMAAYGRGGQFMTNGPQPIMVGDNPGGREMVTVTPITGPRAQPVGGRSITISPTIVVQGGAGAGDVRAAAAEVADLVAREVVEALRNNTEGDI